MTKKILAVLLALAMVISLCCVNVFAADESGSFNTAKMDLAFEWTDGSDNVSWIGSASLFGSREAEFLAAVNTEGAYIEISGTNPCNSHGTMTNIKFNNGDFADLGYPVGTFKRGISAASVKTKSGVSGTVTSATFQFAIYNHPDDCPNKANDTIKINAIKVYVPKAEDDEEEPAEGVIWEMTYPDVATGFTTFLNTSSTPGFMTAINGLGDKAEEAVITFTFTSNTALSSYSYLQLMIRDAGWNDDNITLIDIKNSNAAAFSITYGDLLKVIETAGYSWSTSSLMFILNGGGGDPITVGVTVTAPASSGEEGGNPPSISLYAGGVILDLGDNHALVNPDGVLITTPHQYVQFGGNNVCEICGHIEGATPTTEGEVVVETPTEEPDTEVDPEEGDDTFNANETEPDTNPTTGVVLAVVPMLVAAAAAVCTRKH